MKKIKIVTQTANKFQQLISYTYEFNLNFIGNSMLHKTAT